MIEVERQKPVPSLEDAMRRRDFIKVIGGGAAWPLAARAQQPAMPVIGLLSARPPNSIVLAGFRRGLSDLGYVEGRTIAIEYRSAEFQYDLLSVLAADLVCRRVSVI